MTRNPFRQPARATAGETRMASGVQVSRSGLSECLVRFSLAFILSGASIFQGLSPFAVGFIAASSTGIGSIISLIGGVLGYLLFGPAMFSIKYIAVAVLVVTVSLVLRDVPLRRRIWFMPLTAAAVAGFVSFAAARWLDSAAVRFAHVLTDTALSGGCAYFYKLALSPWSWRLSLDRRTETAHTVSVLILVSTVLLSLAQVTVFDFISVGRVLAALVVFLAAFKGGAGFGGATGLAVGLALDASGGGAAFFCAAYGLSGLVSGIFSKSPRLVFALSFILADAAAAALSIGSDAVPAVLYEVFIASVVFILLPGSFTARLGIFMPGEGAAGGVIKAREYTRSRVEAASLAFRDLYETVKTTVSDECNDGDAAAIFDRAADAVCRKCPKTSHCWHRNYQSTADVMNNATPKMLQRGRLIEADLPAYFTEECKKLDAYIAAVNEELRGLYYRRQYRRRLRDNQAAAINQYSDISAILGGISQELGQGVTFEPELEQRLQKYLQSMNLQPDTAVFRDRGARLHAEISGAGVAALKKSPDYLDRLSAVLGVRLCAPSAAPDGTLKLLEAEPLAAAVGIACVKKKGEDTSGDRGAYFKTDEGLLYVILSDGMGSGPAAAKYAGDAVRILERFLRSGVAPETAVRMLNDLLLLKNEDDTVCATVDLVCINLFTGETDMFKYGAAPSYLRAGGRVRRIRGQSLAAGLGVPPMGAPDHLRMTLSDGCVAVVLSDGAMAGTDDGWLAKKISEFDGGSPRQLASSIVDQACAATDGEDDMTAIAIYVKTRA